MERRFCGIDLGGILEGVRPIDELRTVAMFALEETLTDALPCHVLRDDGAPAERSCLLILGRLGDGLHFVTIDGSTRTGRATADVPLGAIRQAVAAIPDGRPGRGQIQRVLASPHATAGLLMIAVTAAGAMNCAFARNPALHRDDAARLLKAYFTGTILSWTDKN